MSKEFKIEVARIIKDSIHNLVIKKPNELDNNIFFSRTKYFIEMLEGSRNEAYIDGILDPDNKRQFISAAKFYSLDEAEQEKLWDECIKQTGKKPVTTVGIGANISKQKVRDKLDKVLGQKGLMDKVYYGKANLTDEQIEIIFKYDIYERLIELRRIYGEAWYKLRVNERIAILSLHFNYPDLVNEKSTFREHVLKYLETSDSIYLKNAVHEVKSRSNRAKSPGIQNRRDAEAMLLNSCDAPIYTRPDQNSDDVKTTIANVGQTVVPISENTPLASDNSEYFVWRTKMDKKVRQDHVLLESKIFRRDNAPVGYLPGDKHNCRCWAEKIPEYIFINDAVTQKKAAELYLLKGIVHPILIPF